MNKVLYIIGVISLVALGNWFGVIGVQNKLSKSIDKVQATSSYAHLVSLLELESDQLSGCDERVNVRLQQAISEQKMLIAEYIQSADDKQFENYISQRSSGLENELKSYIIDWNKTWTIPSCDKSSN
jgi:hypothetical protein